MRAVISPVGSSLCPRRFLREEVLGRIKSVSTRKMGAERNSLRLILGPPSEDEIYLLPSSGRIIKVAELFRDYYKDKGYSCHIIPIEGLDKGAADLGEGLLSYVAAVSAIIEKHGGEAVINGTPGFKAVMAYNSLLGSLYGIRVYYIHEVMKKLVELPPLPLSYDAELWEKYANIIDDIIERKKNKRIKELPPPIRNLFPSGKAGPAAVSIHKAHQYRRTFELTITAFRGGVVNELRDYAMADAVCVRKEMRISAGAAEQLKKGFGEIAQPAGDDCAGDAAWRQKQMKRTGEMLARRFIHKDILARLGERPGGNLIISLSEGLASLPVENAVLGGDFIWSRFASGRTIIPRRGFVSHLVSPPASAVKKVLIIIADPRGDLKSAGKEARVVEGLFKKYGWDVSSVDALLQNKLFLLEEIEKSSFVHFIGHSAGSGKNTAGAGWVIDSRGFNNSSGRITREDFATLGKIPSFIFANSCSSAEASFLGGLFLLSGVKNYAGNIFPVTDKAARSFAEQFYFLYLSGSSAGKAYREAMIKTRRSCPQYVLYGDPRNKADL